MRVVLLGLVLVPLAACGGSGADPSATNASSGGAGSKSGAAGAAGAGLAGAAGAAGLAGSAGSGSAGSAGSGAAGSSAGFPGTSGAGGTAGSATSGAGGQGTGGTSAGAGGSGTAGSSTAGAGGGCGVAPNEPPGPGGCTFPQGLPDEKFVASACSYQDTDPTVDAAVNAALAKLSGCGVGSDCPITGFPGANADEVCQSFFAAVTDELRKQGFCAGQHAVGSTDEIAVSKTGCAGKWYGYHVCNYGGPKVVWNPGARRGWWAIDASSCP